MHAQGAYLAPVCSGAALRRGDRLDGWARGDDPLGVVDMLRDRYPKVRWRPEHFVTEDSRICCSGGVYASIDISLYLVEKFCGHEIALKTAKSLLVACHSRTIAVRLRRSHPCRGPFGHTASARRRNTCARICATTWESRRWPSAAP
jgi:hypothetical protein